MLAIIVPPCVSAFYQAWIPVVTFDLLNTNWWSADQLLFTFDFGAEAAQARHIPEQTQDIGYQSPNSLIILGSLGLCALFYLIKAILYFLVLLPLSHYTNSERIKAWAKRTKRQLFLGEILQITMVGYFEFLIAAHYTFSYPLSTTDGEEISGFLAQYSFALTMILFPLAWFYLMLLTPKQLQKRRYFAVLGALYSGYKIDKLSLMYYFLFAIRRIFFCYAVFFWAHAPWAQIIGLQLTNVFMVIF